MPLTIARGTLAAAIVSAFALVCATFGVARSAVLVDPRAIPLVDQSGASFRLSDLAGKPAILTFVASRCTDACPIANVAFFKTYERLRKKGIAARLVTVTLDPAYDTPFVMAGFARQFHVPRDAWRFLSGRPRNVTALMRSFGVVAQPDAHGIPEVHSSFVYVLDRHVRLARTLLLSTDLTNEVETELRHR